ncbi:MAG: TIGR03545 family protein [Deltaproteobacteria bacterium]
MRRNFVYFVLVPLVILCVVTYFFVDSWVESGLETGGEVIVGAKVEIDDLSVTLSPLGIRWGRIQVANPRDPWKNFFETGQVRFAMDVGQLLRKKYIIETMEVNDLILGTKRSTDGSLPDGKPKEEGESGTFTALAQEALSKTVQQTPLFNLDVLRGGLNVDSLVSALDIQTLKHIDSLKIRTEGASKQWASSLGDFDNSKKRLAEIETSLKGINPSELKGVDKITAAISTVDNAFKSVKEVENSFNQRKASIEGDVNGLAASFSSIDDVAKKDLATLMSMARLPTLSTSGIARLLVGEEMYKRATTYLYWADLARGNVAKYTPEQKDEDPPRLKGQDIRFPVERGYPKLWIQKILISGGTDSTQGGNHIRARGEARDISDDQSITGKPITITLEGAEGGGRALALDALIDRRKDIPFDKYHMSLRGVPLAEFQLGKSDFLPSKITDARLTSDVTISIPGDRFDSQTSLDFRNVSLVFDAAPNNTIERLVQDVLKGVNAFDVSLRLWNTSSAFDMALATNLDDQIAARLKDVLGAEFTKLQNDLRDKLNATIAEQRQKVERLYSEKRAEVEKQINSYQTLVNQHVAMVEGKKKELTDRLEKEKKGKVEETLKGIFKK